MISRSGNPRGDPWRKREKDISGDIFLKIQRENTGNNGASVGTTLGNPREIQGETRGGTSVETSLENPRGNKRKT